MRRPQPVHEFDTHIANEQAKCRSARSQKHALGQQLPNEPASAGAERAPDHELMLTGLAARHHQVRDVDAGDEEDESDRARKREQRRLDFGRQRRTQRMDR